MVTIVSNGLRTVHSLPWYHCVKLQLPSCSGQCISFAILLALRKKLHCSEPDLAYRQQLVCTHKMAHGDSLSLAHGQLAAEKGTTET